MVQLNLTSQVTFFLGIGEFRNHLLGCIPLPSPVSFQAVFYPDLVPGSTLAISKESPPFVASIIPLDKILLQF